MSDITGDEVITQGGKPADGAPAAGEGAPGADKSGGGNAGGESGPGDKSSGAPDFKALLASLPEDLRDHPSLKPYSQLESLVRSHVNVATLMGKRVQELKPEELAAIDSRFAVPADLMEYNLAPPEGIAVDEKFDGFARQMFKEAGISARQAEALGAKWHEYIGAQQKALDESAANLMAEGETAMRKEWGGKYDARVQAAKRALAHFGGDEMAAYLDETQLGNDPRVIRAFDKIARAVGEDAIGGGTNAGFGRSAAEAAARLNQIKADPGYWDATKPNHASLVQEYQEMLQVTMAGKTSA